MVRPAPAAESPERAAGRSLAAVAVPGLLLLFAVVVVHKAWVTDDAYITFRTVQNFVEGRGLTWNPVERVQVYTHPLWMLAMSAVSMLTGDLFYTSLALNLLLSLVAMALLAFRLASSRALACLGLALLLTSRAFTDFSTSGLENPLAHLLLVLLLLADRREAGPAACLRFSLLASLCLLTRLDLLLLILPAWIVVAWRSRSHGPRAGAALLAGMLPFVAWEGFSLLYYGALLPNTAYAKLNTGIPWNELAAQGGLYLANSLRWDPVTLAAIGGGAGWAAYRARVRPSSRPAAPGAWSIGIALMLVYVVRVGGDFMSGRFLTAPLVVAVGLLVSRRASPRALPVIAALLLAQLLVPWTSPFHERDYGEEWHAAIDAHGIADERSFYGDTGSLMASWDKGEKWPDPRTWEEARWLHRRWPYDYFASDLRDIGELPVEERWPPASPLDASGRPYDKVFLRGAVGFLAFHLGEEAHVLDYHAIGDPLLSRLPATVPDPILAGLIPKLAAKGWRPGHFYRRIPPGYVRTLAQGRNLIRDDRLARYYDAIRRITRDPVFGRERLRTVWRFQWGRFDALLEQAVGETQPGGGQGGSPPPG